MKWYEIKSKAEKAEIWIYEMIGEDFWTGGGVTAKNFQKELSDIKASQIDLHINSPGGDVFDGITIYNLLKQHPANVTTYIDGLAGSIASVIALAGNQINMAENALFMIHNPFGMVMGDATEMRKMADRLDIVRDSIAKAYVSKTEKPEAEIQALMDAETWMTADEAKEYGFADEIEEGKQVAASLNAGILTINGQQIDLKTYKNPPKLVFLPRNGPDTQEQDAKPDADRLFLLGKQLETKKKKYNISEVEKA